MNKLVSHYLRTSHRSITNIPVEIVVGIMLALVLGPIATGIFVVIKRSRRLVIPVGMQH